MSDHKVLFIEDDATTQTLLRLALRGYCFDMAETIEKAQDLLHKKGSLYDAILLDINLPDGNGLDFLTSMKGDRAFNDTPLFVLSGENNILSKITAFDHGADDYIIKPFDPLEVQARLDSRIKKSKGEKRDFSVGDLHFNTSNLTVSKLESGLHNELDLTRKEYELLLLFLKNLEIVFSRQALLEKIWKESNVFDRTIDSHIAKLRKKIQNSSVEIATRKGLGYYSRLRV